MCTTMTEGFYQHPIARGNDALNGVSPIGGEGEYTSSSRRIYCVEPSRWPSKRSVEAEVGLPAVMGRCVAARSPAEESRVATIDIVMTEEIKMN